MSRGVKDPGKRVKTARGRTASSNRWLERQLNDPYVKQAKAEVYRSRAAYKLAELDDRFALLKGVKAVIDLGIAPGGWAQIVAKRAPGAAIVGIDLLDQVTETGRSLQTALPTAATQRTMLLTSPIPTARSSAWRSLSPSFRSFLGP